VTDRPPDLEPDAEPPALDTSDEPEPDWAERIRRGRRERAERLRGLLGPHDEREEEPPS
jgi:hypothetical protein